jgi:O-antigen/teichoic acid export membrane protein
MAEAGHALRSSVVTPSREVPPAAEPSDGRASGAPPLAPPDPDGSAPTDNASGSASNRRVMRGALALFSIQPLTWASSFLLIIYAPQYLSSMTMGQWAILVALGGIASTVLGLGVPTVLVRRVAADPENVAASGAISVVLVTGASVIGCALVALAIHETRIVDLPPLTLELVFGGVVLSLVQTVFLSILNGQHRLGRFAWLSAAGSVTTSIATIAVLLAGGGLLGILFSTLLVAVVVAALTWRASNVTLAWSAVNVASLRALLIAGLPFAGMSLVLRLRGDAEVMLLGLGLSVEVLGWWSAAERISYIALFVPTLLATPLMPALSGVARDAAAFRNTLRRSLDLTVVLTLGASCGVVAIAPAVPATFGWGTDFVSAIPLIELLSLVTPVVSAGIILGTALIALGDERRWFVMSVVASSLHLIVTPAAIYSFNLMSGNGSIGAAIAKLLIEFVMIGGALYLLPRGTVSRSSWVVALKAIVASCVMILAVRMILASLTSWLALPVAIGSGGIIYLIVLATLRILPASELADVSSFIRTTLRRR